MSAWEIRFAQPNDMEAIRHLQAKPMQGAIRLSLIQSLRPTDLAVIAMRGDQLMGMGVRTRARHRWNSQVHWVGVLTGLRSACHLLPRRSVMEMYRLLRSIPAEGDPPWQLTAILEDNHAARRLLEAGLSGMPRYTPVARMLTYSFKAGVKKSRPNLATKMSVSAANCACLVECLEGRKTLVASYAPKLGLLRQGINPIFKLMGRPQLPAPGSELREAFVVDAEWKARDREALNAFIGEIRTAAAALGADLVHWGVPSEHPDAAWLKNHLRAWVTRSLVYAVHDPDLAPPQLIDCRPEVSRL